MKYLNHMPLLCSRDKSVDKALLRSAKKKEGFGDRSNLFHFDKDISAMDQLHNQRLQRGIICGTEDGTGNSTFAMFVRMGNMFSMLPSDVLLKVMVFHV